MNALKSFQRNFAFSSFVLLALAACTMTVSAIEQSGTTHRRLTATLADAPSLKIHFTLKRSSMKIFGQSQFDVFANPIVSSDNTSVIYDGYATFIDGTTEYTYKLVNGIVYVITSSVGGTIAPSAHCLPSILLPPLNDIIPALNNATAVSSAVVGYDTITCGTGILSQATLGGATFVICSSGSNGFTVYGSDIDIAVEYLNNSVTITPPTLSNDEALSCERVVTPHAVSDTTLALLTGQAVYSSNRRTLEIDSTAILSSSSCGCKSIRRPCIFFHGLGENIEKATLQTESEHFGDISESAPCCSSIRYAQLNTVDNPWTDATLQQKVCNFSLSVSNTSSMSSRIIADTIVVTHSMGGLMMAGALANGQCSFAPSTTWVSLSAPMGGSMSSDYLQNACSGSSVFLQAVANLIGRCPVNRATLELAYQDESHSTSAMNAAYVAAQSAFRSNVKAVMCSDNFSGLISMDQADYQMRGTFINHKSKENDGNVEFTSCAGGLPASMFGQTYSDTFYLTGLNHADTAFLHGDGLFLDSHKPIKWFECLL